MIVVPFATQQRYLGQPLAGPDAISGRIEVNGLVCPFVCRGGDLFGGPNARELELRQVVVAAAHWGAATRELYDFNSRSIAALHLSRRGISIGIYLAVLATVGTGTAYGAMILFDTLNFWHLPPTPAGERSLRTILEGMGDR